MMPSLWFDPSWRPVIGEASLALLVRGYGVLLLVTLALLAPRARRMLMGASSGGYTDPSPWRDRLLRPALVWPMLAVWMAAAVALTLGQRVLVAATIAAALARVYFVGLRWTSASRGFGAPGFMTYWVGAAIAVLLWTRALAPAWQWLALLVVQADFAFIMLSSGLYKLRAGYFHGDGMQFGMANPQWGYWSAGYLRWPPDHWLFRTLNHLAWSTEIASGALLLVPATRHLGAWLIVASFLFIATQIRLGTLCWMVMLGAVLFFHPGSAGDQLAAALTAPQGPLAPVAPLAPLAPVAPLALSLYLLLLPLSHLGLWYNFYLRRRLPGLLQTLLDRWTNAFGIIIWRVFSADHTNFFVRVFLDDPRARAHHGERVELTRRGWPPWGRFNHVGESIVLTSLFTTLRYSASADDCFRERLLRVAGTMPPSRVALRRPGGAPTAAQVVFRVVAIDRDAAAFACHDVSEWIVNLQTGQVDERRLDPSRSIRTLTPHSPIHEAAHPGTYAPAAR